MLIIYLSILPLPCGVVCAKKTVLRKLNSNIHLNVKDGCFPPPPFFFRSISRNIPGRCVFAAASWYLGFLRGAYKNRLLVCIVSHPILEISDISGVSRSEADRTYSNMGSNDSHPSGFQGRQSHCFLNHWGE